MFLVAGYEARWAQHRFEQQEEAENKAYTLDELREERERKEEYAEYDDDESVDEGEEGEDSDADDPVEKQGEEQIEKEYAEDERGYYSAALKLNLDDQDCDTPVVGADTFLC